MRKIDFFHANVGRLSISSNKYRDYASSLWVKSNQRKWSEVYVSSNSGKFIRIFEPGYDNHQQNIHCRLCKCILTFSNFFNQWNGSLYFVITLLP